jgi:hypothetical protein
MDYVHLVRSTDCEHTACGQQVFHYCRALRMLIAGVRFAKAWKSVDCPECLKSRK